jgi:hypothetical protein
MTDIAEIAVDQAAVVVDHPVPDIINSNIKYL